jgi:hypothetical protein
MQIAYVRFLIVYRSNVFLLRPIRLNVLVKMWNEYKIIWVGYSICLYFVRWYAMTCFTFLLAFVKSRSSI